MLDADLAELYGVETKALNRALRRNLERFPNDFVFQLTESEFKDLRFQFGTSRWGGRRYDPAGTRQAKDRLSRQREDSEIPELNKRPEDLKVLTSTNSSTIV